MFWAIPKFSIDKYLNVLIFIKNKSNRPTIAMYGTIIPMSTVAAGAGGKKGQTAARRGTYDLFFYIRLE